LLTLVEPNWSWGGHGTPLLGLHLLGQEQGFTEELNGAGVGDACDADEQLQGVLELLVGVDEDVGLLVQVFDLGVESGDAVLQIRDQEVWCRRSGSSGLELVSGLGSELVEGGNRVRAQARLVRTRASMHCQG